MRSVPALTLVTVAAFCTLWIALGSQIIPGARKHDFLNLYTGASLALEGQFSHLHDPAVQLARERRFVPELPALVPFVRPHFYALLIAPLALVPFAAAFWVWMGLQSALLMACWIWASRRWGPDALVFGALYLPTALGIAHGQDCVVMLAILIVAYTLADHQKLTPAGAALGLGTIKFHLFMLWPLLLLWRSGRMLAGFCAVVFAEVAASLLLAGPGGLARYVDLLRNKDLERLNPSPELMINLQGLALNLGLRSGVVQLALAGLVLMLAGLAAYRAPLWRWFSAAAAGGLLIAPHVYGYDAGLLLLPIWLAIYQSKYKSTRLATTALATPLPFLLSLAGSPWAAAAPLAILLFLAMLARESLVAAPDHASIS